MKYRCLLAALLWGSVQACAQADSAAILSLLHKQADVLAGPAMHGRGYVLEGRTLAANYIEDQFRSMGLVPAPGMDGYGQPYTFPINTFPSKMLLEIDGKELTPGVDYLIDASAPSMTREGMKVKTVDLGAVNTAEALKATFGDFDGSSAYLLLHADTVCKALGAPEEALAQVFPPGCYILPESKKLTWTVDGEQSKAVFFYVKQDALPGNIRRISVDERAVRLPASQNQNLIATVPGTVKDTFIAITAHYDHLGMMGSKTIFPGASDNASGTAMLLYLASWFAAHPQHYSVLFIAFSGEEAGLLGSAYYVKHPIVPLANIRFLTNIDIMGDATDGITVVNATEFPKQFALLNEVNDAQHYIPVVKSRGKAHNSDHWNFTEAGVPSFFFYSNGGKGYYHDVFDKPAELTLNHVAGVAHLVIDFVKGLQ